jgi:CubicO group peptidase (beta-lactamase class C family)
MSQNKKASSFAIFFVAFLLSLGGGNVTWVIAQQNRGPYQDKRQLPAAPLGTVITELVETINSADEQRAKTFLEEKVSDEFRSIAPMEEHLSVFKQIHDQSQVLEFYAVRQYERQAPDDETVVIVRNKLTEGWQALVLKIAPQPPHLITSLGFSPARPPSDVPRVADLSNAEIVERLSAFVDRLAKADAFSGTVLLAKDGEVLFQTAHGRASKRFDVPINIDTKFNLGSMNKMFTGVAIMQLVQRGELSLDDPLSQYVSTEWLPEDVTKKIQVQHLLTHTSGLGSYFNEQYDKSSKALFRKLNDYQPLVRDSTLAFEPGSDWKYSNTGMFLLGVVIESVTGQDYFQYIRDNIYEPAGMSSSDCYEMDRPVPNLAIGYLKEDGDWKNNLYMHVIRGGPAGGGFSTVGDLLRFDQALRGHKLLNEALTERVWSAKPEQNSPNYGFGFSIRGTEGNRIVGHGGGFPGINSNLDMFLDSGYTAIVMSNYSSGATPIADKMRELVSAAD